MKVLKLFTSLIALCVANEEEINCSHLNNFINPCECLVNNSQLNIWCQDVTFENTTISDFGAGSAQFSVKKLHIQNTNIKRIEWNSFSRFFFEQIYISQNVLLENIDQNAFTGTLKILILHNNTKLSQNSIFDLISNLMPTEVINISYSNIDYLPRDAFGSNSKVKLIDLSYNNILTLTDYVFNSLIGLKELILSHNQINYIYGFVFDSPQNLTINLNNNRLSEQSFMSATVSMLSNDVVLDLSENNFFVLHRNLFENFVKGTRNKLIFNGNTKNQFYCDTRMKWVHYYPNSLLDIWCANLNRSLLDVDYMLIPEPCDNFPEECGCYCYAENLEIRCQNNKVLSRMNLKRIGENLNQFSENFYLFITETNLDMIETNVFASNTSFKRIEIVNNPNLTAIQEKALALQSCEGLCIINNPVLSYDLLELLSTSTQLELIFLEKNKLERITENLFNRENFIKVTKITLNEQNVQKFVIEKNAFGLLTNLYHLDISNKNLQLSENFLNLSVTQHSDRYVYVKIVNSNITNWNSKFIVQPESSEMRVDLNLQYNPINLGDKLIFDQFNEFFSYEKNQLFITVHEQNCDCYVAKKLLVLNEKYIRLNGLHCLNTYLCLKES